MDYNELVDDLEEEHLKREVFTTEKNEDQELNSHDDSQKSITSKISDMIFNNHSDKERLER